MSNQPTDVTPALLRDWPRPDRSSSKKDRGDVLVIGGAARTPGAALLSGLAALRVGAGRLTVAVAESVAPALAVAMPEAGVVGLAQTRGGSVRGDGLEPLYDQLDVGVVLVGPGLDDPDETARLIADLVPRLEPDCVLALDAYALGALPGIRGQLEPLAGRMMLTPNSTEAERLLEHDLGEPEDDIAEIARRYAAVVSGKGFVADADGGLWRIGAGHPGLATAGSGDVLAGAIAGVASGGADLTQAACWGTYVHAAAGDRLAARIGRLGFLAREICAELPLVLAELSA